MKDEKMTKGNTGARKEKRELTKIFLFYFLNNYQMAVDEESILVLVIHPVVSCYLLLNTSNLSQNSARELKFNTTGQCVPPLVATEEESSWYEGVKGCGIQCANPIFTPQEHEDLHQFVATIGGICLACAALTVVSWW